MKQPFVAAAFVVLALASLGATQWNTPAPAAKNDESATARRFAAIRRNPERLRAFLHAMPKGGDLHNHLSGAVYAEDFLQWAADDGLCLTIATLSIVAGTCDESRGLPPVAAVLKNGAVFGQAVDAMSMRHWDRSLNGHDHFFATFGKFGPASKTGEMIAVVTSRAAAEHVSYLELMMTPDGGASTAIGRTVPADADLGRWRDRLLAAGLRDAVVGTSKQRLDGAEARQRELLACGTPAADAGCGVTVRYVAQVSRASAPEIVFAQMLAWFELAGADPRVVALNLVQPEDDPTAVRDFSLHMSMLDFLHGKYPAVSITLHAGELTEGLVPPPVLRFHIRQSIEVGHASRIGHGVAVINEDDPYGLLREMAKKKILVEIALTSNDQILDVKGARHPLKTYLDYGVPVAIATDDMGVARSSHTGEFAKAVEEQGLDYPALKKLVHNSLDYAFADAATKTRLKGDLEKAFRVFERAEASR